MKTILIVDDELSIRKVIKEYFRLHSDYQVITACDSEQALEYFRQRHIDLMITNINMPGMNGIELTRHVTERYKAKVIVATAWEGYQDEAFDAGAIEYVMKPVNLESLLKLINKILLNMDSSKNSIKK